MDFGEIILDLLSFSQEGISISDLSSQIKKKGFNGDYKNTHNKIMKFNDENIISIKKIGNSSTILLNYNNPKTIASLAKMELSKKISFLEKNPSFENILNELTKLNTKSILLSSPQKNFNLNRIEMLALTEDSTEFFKELNKISKKYSIRIDCLALKSNDFLNLIKSSNPIITEFLYDKLILINQEYFFNLIKKISSEKRLIKRNYFLEDLNENELRYNLSKCGYSEFGKEEKTKELCFEELIISTLLNGTARQKTALKEILNKNEFNIELLAFLTKKYSKEKEISLLTKNKKLLDLLKVIF
jgi:hypothetical protein